MSDVDCIFCKDDGGEVLWRDDRCRIVLAAEPDFRGFCRVVWHAHVKEMTDLSEADRARLMNAVFATESALRRLLEPDKINLASLGNLTPHLHWHVIPRYRTDSRFPDPVWNPPRRASSPATSVDTHALKAMLHRMLDSNTPA